MAVHLTTLTAQGPYRLMDEVGLDVAGHVGPILHAGLGERYAQSPEFPKLLEENKQYLGKKLRAYPGVWALESGTTFSYEWLIGDTVVGTGSTYAVTKAAKNKRVTLRVLAENGTLNGTAVGTASATATMTNPMVAMTMR